MGIIGWAEAPNSADSNGKANDQFNLETENRSAIDSGWAADWAKEANTAQEPEAISDGIQDDGYAPEPSAAQDLGLSARSEELNATFSQDADIASILISEIHNLHPMTGAQGKPKVDDVDDKTAGLDDLSKGGFALGYSDGFLAGSGASGSGMRDIRGLHFNSDITYNRFSIGYPVFRSQIDKTGPSTCGVEAMQMNVSCGVFLLCLPERAPIWRLWW